MYSFYPGPSQVWPQLPEWTADAYASGILGQNHRSPAFQELYKALDTEFRRVHQLPDDYAIFFTSSATECWEIIAQSVIGKNRSLHVSQGAFAEKWCTYTNRLSQAAQLVEFSTNSLPLPEKGNKEATPKLVALTHTETSAGLTLPHSVLQEYRNTYANSLIAVDATSSMGGISLPWMLADIWFASAQKCLGLPAGIGLLICNTKAVEVATESNYYNSLSFIARNAKQWQTTHTPNVIGVYWLYRSLQNLQSVNLTEKLLWQEAEALRTVIQNHADLDLAITRAELQSPTVLAVKLSEPLLTKIKADAFKEGFLLGNGYGPLKDQSFRIANFPAMPVEIKNRLRQFLVNWR